MCHGDYADHVDRLLTIEMRGAPGKFPSLCRTASICIFLIPPPARNRGEAAGTCLDMVFLLPSGTNFPRILRILKIHICSVVLSVQATDCLLRRELYSREGKRASDLEVVHTSTSERRQRYSSTSLNKMRVARASGGQCGGML